MPAWNHDEELIERLANREVEEGPAQDSELSEIGEQFRTLVMSLQQEEPPDPYGDEPACRDAVATVTGLVCGSELARTQDFGPHDAHACAIPAEPTEELVGRRLLSRLGAGSRETESLPANPGETVIFDETRRDTPSPRASVPGYEILGELGRGGMGVVYKARQAALGRLVALKMVLAGDHAGHHERVRFLAEAQTVARLHHPHIVQIYEVGEHDGRPYFSMEFVDGGNLAQKLSGMPLPAREAAELVIHLASAIHAAHQRGVIHRDLKPGNVLITVDGQPKITDFGLAKQMGTEGGPTLTGDILGTPSYMAPEQALGDIHRIAPTTDIYSLGVILYQILTGRVPFAGRTPIELVRKVITEEPAPPSTIIPRTPVELEIICLKCLQKDPARRYEDAQALADDLQRWLQGIPILARPVGSIERAWRWCRRNRTVTSLIALVFVSLVAGTAIASYFAVDSSQQAKLQKEARTLADQKTEAANQSADRATKAEGVAEQRRNDAVTAQHQAETALGLAETRRLEADAAREETSRKAIALEDQIYRDQIAIAHRELLGNNLVVAQAVLNRTDPKRRGWEWSYCNALCSQSLYAFRKEGREDGHGVCWRPDGLRLAVTGSLGNLCVLDAVTGEEIYAIKLPLEPKTFNYSSRFNTVAWSPDGKLLGVAGLNGNVHLLEADTGKLIREWRGFPRPGIHSIAFSPDGRRIAGTSGEEGQVHTYEARVWETDTGKLLLNLTGHTHTLGGVAFSPDGKLLATGGDHTGKLWDLSTGQEIRTLVGHQNTVYGVAFTPDGSRVITTSMDGRAIVWNVSDGRRLTTFTGHQAGLRGVSVAPDGSYVSTAGTDRTIRPWDLTGREMFAIPSTGWSPNQPAFSPDGRRLAVASSGDMLRVFTTQPNRHWRELTGHTRPIRALSLSADGKEMVTLVQEGHYPNEYCLWSLPDGELVRRETRLRDADYLPFPSVTLSADGTRMLTGGSHQEDHRIRLSDPVSGRVLAWITDHGSPFFSTALSPDGKTAAVAHENGSVVLWDVDAKSRRTTLQGHTAPVRSLTFSRDGRRLASLGEGGLLIHDLSGSLVQSLPAKGTSWSNGLRPFDFSYDGSRIAVCGVLNDNGMPNGNAIGVFEVESGKLVSRTAGQTTTGFAVAFSPDGLRLACGSPGSSVKILETATGEELLTLRGHTDAVQGLTFTPDGRLLISAGADGRVLLWDTWPVSRGRWKTDSEVPPEVRWFAASLRERNPDYRGKVAGFRLEGKEIVELSFDGQEGLTDISACAALTKLRSLNLNGTRVTDLSPLKGLPLRELRCRDARVEQLAPLAGMKLEALDVRSTPVGDLSLLAGLPLRWLGCDADLAIRQGLPARMRTLEQVNETPVAELGSRAQHEVVLSDGLHDVRSATVSPDGKHVVTAEASGRLRLWNAETGAPLFVVSDAPATIRRVAWSRETNRILVVQRAPGAPNDELLMLDMSDRATIEQAGPVRSTHIEISGRGESLAVSHKGLVAAVGGTNGVVQLYDVASERAQGALPAVEQPALALAFTPDDALLAVGTGLLRNLVEPGMVHMFDLARPENPRSSSKIPNAVRWLDFAPDGVTLGMCGGSRFLLLGSIETGKKITAFRPHDGRPRVFAFLNASTILTAGEERELVLWDIPSSAPLAKYSGHRGPLIDLSLSADLKVSATTSDDGTVRIRRLDALPKAAKPSERSPDARSE